jgi:hypothetical protein
MTCSLVTHEKLQLKIAELQVQINQNYFVKSILVLSLRELSMLMQKYEKPQLSKEDVKKGADAFRIQPFSSLEVHISYVFKKARKKYGRSNHV